MQLELQNRIRRLVSRRTTHRLGTYRPGGTWLSGWDGGSREAWYFVRRTAGGGLVAELMHTEPDPDRTGDPFKQRRVFPEPPADAVAAVQCGTFMGKPGLATICPLTPNQTGESDARPSV